MPLPKPVNPPLPGPFTDEGGNLNVGNRSMLNALVLAFNFIASNAVAGPVTVTLFGPTTNGSLTIQNGVITGVVAPT